LGSGGGAEHQGDGCGEEPFHGSRFHGRILSDVETSIENPASASGELPKAGHVAVTRAAPARAGGFELIDPRERLTLQAKKEGKSDHRRGSLQARL
jgi:hypothetical protein